MTNRDARLDDTIIPERRAWRFGLMAVAWMFLLATCANSVQAGSVVSIDPVKLKVNGVEKNIGKIDASLSDANLMEATFTLSKDYAFIASCVTFQWLQVVTALADSPTNPKYKTKALTIPIIDTPNGGYDGQVGEDDKPWYLTADDIKNNGLNGTDADGNLFFKTNDTPSVKGATFDTWLVADMGDKMFCVIAGFSWGIGTLAADLAKKNNANGTPVAADLTTITTALKNGGFVDAKGDANWFPQMDCDIKCTPEPGSFGLALICVFTGAGAIYRKRKAA